MIYLDNAATTVHKPPSVLRAQRQAIRCAGNAGRGGHTLSLAAAQTLYRCRCAAAEFFGMDLPERVVLTMNATHALNLVLFGILQRGDRVLYSDLAHNSVRRPIAALRERGVKSEMYSVLEKGALLPQAEIMRRLEKLLETPTRMIALTHVSNLCAAREPLEKIAALSKKRGVLLLADASQSAGILPLSMKIGIDYLCCAGHKGLYGPQGSGLLLIGEGAPLPRPLLCGGAGVFSEEEAMPQDLPERLEAGTMNVPAAAGLCAGLRFLSHYEKGEIAQHHAALGQRLQAGLLEIPGARVFLPQEQNLGTVLFSLGAQAPEQTAWLLDRSGVYMRAGLHCAPLAHAALGTLPRGALRASVGMDTTKRQIDKTLYLLSKIAKDSVEFSAADDQMQ